MAGLLDYLRPGFPKSFKDAAGLRYNYEMVGPDSTLLASIPAIGSTWLDSRPVLNTAWEYVGKTNYVILMVETYKVDTQATAVQNDEQYPFWEIDQVQVEKSLKQHPEFIAFTAADWAAIQAWDNELDQELKSAYQYYKRDADGKTAGSIQTLTGTTSTGQKAYAYLRLRGVESFLDFAPVVRRTSRYLGSAAPDSSDAGQKTTAPTYAPADYEWLKTADRISKQGTKGIEWVRQEEWTGARKILLDKDDLFTS